MGPGRLGIRHAAEIDAGHIAHIIGRHLHAHLLPYQGGVVIHYRDVFFDDGNIVSAQGIDVRRDRQVEHVERTLPLLCLRTDGNQQAGTEEGRTPTGEVCRVFHSALKDTHSLPYNGKNAREVCPKCFSPRFFLLLFGKMPKK